MSLDDGLPNPPVGFPNDYFQNPAPQRAFESFWANRPGPGGIGLQDRFVEGLRAVARRFAGNPCVIGYELMNEPWPGAVWFSCLSADGCPDLEAKLLRPFYDRATAAVRRITRRQRASSSPSCCSTSEEGRRRCPAVTAATRSPPTPTRWIPQARTG